MHSFDVGSTVYNHSIVQFDPFKIRSSLFSWMKKLKSDAKKKKKKQSMSSDEKTTNWALWYMWQTLSHTLLAEHFCGQISLSSLWRQLLWQKPRLLPAWLPSLPFSTKILSRRLAPTQWQTNYIKAFPPLREQNSFSYQYQDKYNGFVIVIF